MKSHRSAISKLIFTLFISISLTATTSNAAPLSLEQQRAIYLKAKQAYTDKKVQQAAQLTIRIKNYPLHPYLELLQIQRDINSISQNKIDAFTHTYKQTPLAKKAQASYLQKLANKKQWKQFLIN